MKYKLKAFLLPTLLSGWAVLILFRYFKNTPPLPLYLPEFLMLGFILLIAFLLGKGLLGCLGFQEEFCLRFFLLTLALGFGALALFILILGQFKLLYPELMLGLSFLFIFLARSVLISLLTHIYTGIVSLRSLHFSLGSGVLWLTFFVMSFLGLIHALAPPVFFDTLTWHLGLPNLYLQDHRISTYPYIAYSYYSLNMEMIYTFSLLLYKSHILPTLLHFIIGILAALSIYELSQRFFGKKVGLMALLIFYSTPMVMLLSTVAKSDLLLVYFEILSLLSLILWFKEGKDSELVLSAILCGLAIGTKYFGGYFFITLCLLILLHGFLQRRKKYRSIEATFPSPSYSHRRQDKCKKSYYKPVGRALD